MPSCTPQRQQPLLLGHVSQPDLGDDQRRGVAAVYSAAGRGEPCVVIPERDRRGAESGVGRPLRAQVLEGEGQVHRPLLEGRLEVAELEEIRDAAICWVVQGDGDVPVGVGDARGVYSAGGLNDAAAACRSGRRMTACAKQHQDQRHGGNAAVRAEDVPEWPHARMQT